MRENLLHAAKKGEENAAKYNPRSLVPFPFEKVTGDCSNLQIEVSDRLDRVNEKLSGVLIYKKIENGSEDFRIFINNQKPKNRQYFTLAHELGHYFLHKDELKKGGVLDNDETTKLFRLDGSLSDDKEREANHFAASLIMPEKEVRKVWDKVKDVDECSNIFEVSQDAMSIRLANLRLI